MSFIFDNKSELDKLKNKSINQIEANLIRGRISKTESTVKNIDSNIDNIIKGVNNFIYNTENNFKKVNEIEKTLSEEFEKNEEFIEGLKSDFESYKKFNTKQIRFIKYQLYSVLVIWVVSFIFFFGMHFLK